MSFTSSSARSLLKGMFYAAVAAADPTKIIPSHLPMPPKGRTIVVGAGKASAAMARSFEKHYSAPLTGLVITRYGHAVACERIEIVEASHPVPNGAGAEATSRMLQLVSGLTEDDLVIGLFSGGGSALLSAPASGISLSEKQGINRTLLASGASIDEMNCVRKHLSAVKGGRLAAAAWPARVETFLISDVPGDDPSTIASGPMVPDPTTFLDARSILERYGITPPASIIRHLHEAAEETPKPGDPRLRRSRTQVIATPQMSLLSAAAIAKGAGITPIILGDAIEGESREVATVMAGLAKQVRRYAQPAAAPCVLLSGGETTVTLRGNGRGGRNVEFLAALALALDNEPGTFAIAADTDGIDGAEEFAGAIILPDTCARAKRLGLRIETVLANNDAHTFFQALEDSVITGPTLTNVNDFRAVLIV
jgi:glycerate 2-kinase